MAVVNVRCDRVVADRLAAVVKAARQVEKDWLAERRGQVAARVRAEKLRVAERDVLLDEVAETFAALRAAGQFRGTRTLVVLPQVHAVIEERGWTGRSWRPVPPRARSGRPWGTHDQHFAARVALTLPDDLADTIARACYWTSLPAVAALQRWYDEHGDHWRGRLHDPDARWVGEGPSHADQRDRERLVAEVVTTGTVLREAIEKSLPDQQNNRG
jgi:hypothetical protein